MFTDNDERLFVGAQSEKGGVSHFALARPFREFYLANELWNKPRGVVLVFTF